MDYIRLHSIAVKKLKCVSILVSSATLPRYADVILDGIDTVATLRMNNVSILRINNMFRRFTANVENLLKVRSVTIHYLLQCHSDS